MRSLILGLSDILILLPYVIVVNTIVSGVVAMPVLGKVEGDTSWSLGIIMHTWHRSHLCIFLYPDWR